MEIAIRLVCFISLGRYVSNKPTLAIERTILSEAFHRIIGKIRYNYTKIIWLLNIKNILSYYKF